MEADLEHYELLRRVFERWVANWPGPPLIALPAVSATATSAVYAFADVAREIVIWVSRDISVAAMRGDHCWDLLTDFDVLPQQHPDGEWTCAYSDCSDARSFPSVEELLQAHLIDPLKEWIFSTLCPARWLELHEAHGATWARLETTFEAECENLTARFRVHDWTGEPPH